MNHSIPSHLREREVEIVQLRGRRRARNYYGVLVSPLEIGKKMVVLLARSRRIVTSSIERIVEDEGRLLVETGSGSTYALEFPFGSAFAYHQPAEAS